MTEYITGEQKREVLNAAVIRGDFVLASGLKSSQKFDFDRISTDSPLFEVCIDGLARCIKENLRPKHFTTILTVATGANRLGGPLAERLSVGHLPSRKQDGQFSIPEPSDQNINALLVDDVYTTGSSMEKLRKQFKGRIVAAAVILDRSGRDAPMLASGEPVYSVIRHTIESDVY